MEKVKRIAVSLPSELAEKFEKTIRKKAYSNRSKAVADVFRDYLSNLEWQKRGNVVGTITIIYDHHTRGVTDKLTELQHDFWGTIKSSLHVHLDHDNCLEVIVALGNAKKIEKLANSLIATRGVRHGKLVCSALG
jgi:CopG family nickel-responsive transcriptional regulator